MVYISFKPGEGIKILEVDFITLRKRMVQEQLALRGIKDPQVLAAFEKVPRHKFVLAKQLKDAYGDFPLSIGAGQTISQPYIVALMTQCLELSQGKRVLEIGTGSGYQTAILSELTEEVYSVERIAKLAEQAQGRLNALGYSNVQIKVADGALGWPEHAPYDGIVVTCASPVIPDPLLEQLATKAKLVIPLGTSHSQILTVANKHKGKIEINEICGCIFVPLVGKYGWSKPDA